MPPALLEGFSQVTGPAHAAAGQGDHGDQQGGDCGVGVGGAGLGVVWPEAEEVLAAIRAARHSSI